jgi:nucleotide-binding universal stress UspA family protein
MSTEQPPVVAVFSPLSGRREPLDFALAASRLTGAPLVVAVVRRGGAMVGALAGSIDDDPGAPRVLEHLREDLRRRRAQAEVRVFEARTEAGALERAMAELQPRLMVLEPSHRRSLSAAILGSTLERVIHASTCPVAVVPEGHRPPDGGIRVVGVAFVPTDEGREALRAAAAIARAGDVKLRAVAVLDPALAGENAAGLLAGPHHEADPASAARGREGLGERSAFAAAVAELGVESETDVLFESDPARALIDASHTVDLLVVGSRGQGPRRAVILGSVSRKVAEGAACPVLIVPRAAAGATESLLAHSTAP